METLKEKREKAQRLYCVEELSASKIANKLRCNIKTIYAWRDKYGWVRSSCTVKVIRLKHKEFKQLVWEINQITDENLRFSILTKLMKGQKL